LHQNTNSYQNHSQILVPGKAAGGGHTGQFAKIDIPPAAFPLKLSYASLRVFLFIRLLELLFGSKTVLQLRKKSVTSFLR
jgi:hypothetical protein